MSREFRSADLDYGSLLSWFQTVITHPRTATEGASSPEAQQLLPCPVESIDSVVLPSKTLSGLQRLAIYARSYHARLAECLMSDHSALAHALALCCQRHGQSGKANSWRSLVSDYVAAHPPSHYDLEEFARHLPAFMASGQSELLDRLPERAMLAELANLERVVVETFHLQTPRKLTPDDVACISPECLMNSKLELAQGVELLNHSYPVHGFLSSCDSGEEPPLPDPEQELLVIYRKGHRVWRMTLGQPAFALLRSLARGRRLHRALEVALRLAHTAPEQSPAQAAAWLQELTAEGLFGRVITS